MDWQTLRAGFLSRVCGQQFALVTYLAICVTFFILSVYSYIVVDPSTSAFVITQINILLVSLFISALVGMLYVCNRRR